MTSKSKLVLQILGYAALIAAHFAFGLMVFGLRLTLAAFGIAIVVGLIFAFRAARRNLERDIES